jgi:hypothetical protein
MLEAASATWIDLARPAITARFDDGGEEIYAQTAQPGSQQEAHQIGFGISLHQAIDTHPAHGCGIPPIRFLSHISPTEYSSIHTLNSSGFGFDSVVSPQ